MSESTFVLRAREALEALAAELAAETADADQWKDRAEAAEAERDALRLRLEMAEARLGRLTWREVERG